jgi:phage-related protein
LKKFDALIDGARAHINAFTSSLQIKPSIDDGSVQQFGEAIDTVQAKAESLSERVIASPVVDDTSLKQFEKTIDDMTGKIEVLVSRTIAPPVDSSSIHGLSDEVDKTKAKTDALRREKIRLDTDLDSLRELGEEFNRLKAKFKALGGTKMKPETDTKPVEKLGDEVDKTKAKADALGGTKVKLDADGNPIRGLGDEVDKTKNKVASLTTAILNANLIISAFSRVMGAAFGFVRDAVIGATAETERYRVAIGAMIGDQEKANKIIHDLDSSSVSDFYGTANTIGGLQGMITFGMRAEEASDILTRIGDIAQGNSEAFVSMSNNMGQVFAKGKADAIDLKQFVTQGFDVVGEVAKQSGKSRVEIEKAGVTYEQTAAALRALTSEGGKYNGMLAKQTNTLGGVLKQFASLKAATANAIGTGIVDELKELLKYILEIGRAGQKSFVNVFVKALKEVIHWIWQIIIMWEVLGYRLAGMGDALAPVRGFFASLRDAARDVLTGIMKLVIALGKAFLALAVPISAFLTPIIQAFGKIAKKVLTGIGDIINEITPAFLEWTPIFETIGKAIGQAFEKIMPVLNNVKNAIIAAVEPLKAFLTPIVESLQPLFEKVFGAIGKLFRRAEEDTNGLADTIKGLTPVFSFLGDIVAFLIDIFGTGLGWIIESLGPFLKYILLIVGAIKAWSIVQGILNAVMAINPVSAWIMAIVALIAGIGLLIKNWDKVKEGFSNTGKAIGDFFSGAGEKIKSFASSVAEKVGGAFTALKTRAGKGAQNMVAAFAERFTYLYRFIVGILSTIKEMFGKLADIIRPPVEAFINAVKTGCSTIIGIFKAAGLSVFNVMKAVFTSIWNIIKTIFTSVWGVIKSVFDAIKNTVIAAFNVFKTVFFSIFNVIKGVFSTIFNTALSVFDGIIGIWRGGGTIFSKIWESIKLIFTSAFNAILDIARTIGNAFIAVWESVGVFFIAIWEGAGSVFNNILAGIAKVFTAFVEAVKSVWGAIPGFFSGLWDSIVSTTMTIWDTLKSWFSELVEGIERIWNGIIGFFTGLWDALTQGPAAAIEYIKNAFFGLFNSIQEKLFGFISNIKEGWETVKGFFGGVIGGVVNFFTGGDDSLAKDAPAKVNDMILTPEGRFETNPNDYIMAMRDPASLARSGQERGNSAKESIAELVKAVVSSIHIAAGMIVNAIHGIVFGTNNQYSVINNADNRADNRAYNSSSTTNAYSYGGNESAIYNTFSENGGLMGMLALLRDPLLKMTDMLARFLMAQQPQAAYAGGSQAAMAGAAGQTSRYAYTTMGGATVNVQNSMNITVPPGTSQEQTESIARQVGAQVDAKLASLINSSLANIPSPEVRRR